MRGHLIAPVLSAGTASALVLALAAPGGIWGKAEEVPGSAALNKGGNATVESLSCASPSHCSAGGYYRQGRSAQELFVVNKG